MKQEKMLGERKIIEIIRDNLDLFPRMPVPFGDDTAACEIEDGRLAVLKTDMLVGKTDVPKCMTMWQAARKAVVMNISDFAAKGVKPLVLLASLGLPRNLSRSNIEQIAKGLNSGAREYDAYVIGGDTGEATDLVISISLFGLARAEEVMLRSQAEAGDVVAVTGSFGKTSAGLKILSEGCRTPKSIRGSLVESVLLPLARLKEGLALKETRAVTASIDSSDGLAWSLHEIGRASDVGFLIDNLPVAEEAVKFAEMNGLDLLQLALYGGEEYELVVTVKPGMWRKALYSVEKVGGRLIPIGKVIAQRRLILKVGGKRIPIETKGYEHFSNDEL